jgi:pSer/pThr/pTyr-binding forkhead associated (FHA) protein
MKNLDPEAGGGTDAESTLRFNEDWLLEDSSELSEEHQAAVAALPAGSALLVVRQGPNSGSRFLLDSDITTVGRHPNADIFLDDVTVSRRHAEFHRHGSSFQVQDLASLNGTYYDGVRIESALLDDGGEVQIGKFKMTFYEAKPNLDEQKEK